MRTGYVSEIVVNRKLYACIGLAGWLAGCGADSPKPAPATVDVPAAAPSTMAVAPEPPKPTELDLRPRVCKGRPDCSVVSVRKASAAGAAPLDVVLVSLGPAPSADGEAPIPAVTTTEVEDTFEARYGDCAPFEYWLVRAGEPPRLLLEICNDGHGASGVGEDHVAIPGNGTLAYSVNGGSAWRWDREVRLSFDPLRLLNEESSGMWTLGENEEAETWDWETFAGSRTWSAPRCDPSTGEPSTEIAEHAFVSVPHVAVDEGFASGGWRAHGLGRCAAHVGDSKAAELGAVVMGDVLYVEVTDDRITSKDVLEVWVADRPPGYMDHCLGPKLPAAGVAISLSTKKARSLGKKGSGPAAVLVEAVTSSDGGVFRASVRLPGPEVGLGVVLRDSDNDRTVNKVVSTSEIDPGDTATLGQPKVIPPSVAACGATGGRLEPVFATPAADTPFLPM